MSEKLNLDAKRFFVLLLGIVKRNFYGEKGLANEDLQQEVFSQSSVPPEEVAQIIAECEQLLVRH
jgi:hypothetical protein